MHESRILRKDMRRRPVGVALHVAIVFLVCSFSRTSPAQTASDPTATSTFDIYGNARSLYPRDRHPMGMLQSNARPRPQPSFQTSRPTLRQRSFFMPFALLGDRRPRKPGGSAATVRPRSRPSPPWVLSRESQRSYLRYGGYGRRPRTGTVGDAAAAFARRTGLVEATALNAPVHRATMQRPLIGMRSSIDRTPFLSTGDPSDSSSTATLEQRLAHDIDTLHRRAKAEGWRWFAEGAYRRASRSFETAWRVEPADYESRLGELFCHVSIANLQTAVTLLRQLNRRDWNPFVHQINLTQRFSRKEAARVGVEMQLLAESETGNRDASALGVLVLWYLDRRGEALSTAVARARGPARDAYADWPARMRAAWEAGNPAGDRP